MVEFQWCTGVSGLQIAFISSDTYDDGILQASSMSPPPPLIPSLKSN